MEPIIWLAVYGVELVFFGIDMPWRLKKGFAWLLMPAIIASSALFYRLDYGIWFHITLSINLFRVLNVSRILKSRMHPLYAQQVTRRTSYALGIIVSLAMAFTLPVIFTYFRYIPYAQAAVALLVLLITLKNIRKLRFAMPQTFLVDKELPTVTVAIPARNETTDLEECLESILANDYPKLEVLVLDDCSQDKTAEIIRSFANRGVRFVQGADPAERWLAKNQAYDKLYQEANGDLMLFCGVDVRLGKHAIRSMVNVLHSRNKAMLSVLPVRDRSTPSSAFIQPMRYWWELALPRRTFNRPPVLSTCWLVDRDKLKHLGGFAAISHTLLPEGFFAREFVKTDEYSFIRSSNELEVRTVKNVAEQRATAIRTLYPKIRRRPENALLLTLINASFLIAPFVLFALSFHYEAFSTVAAGIACAALILTHLAIVYISDPSNALLAALTMPIAVLVETVFGYISMIQYEFFTVEWKNRNICIPVMHVIPKQEFLAETTKK